MRLSLLLATLVVGLSSVPVPQEASAAPLISATPRMSPAALGNPVEEVYYYNGRYYPYYYHGGYYPYRYHGAYYGHRLYRNGVWHYY